MALLKLYIKRIVVLIIIASILLTFCAIPSSYAKLDLKEGDFYYSGTTKGTYTVKDGVFSWLLSCLADIADWILGVISMGFRMIFVGWTALIEKLLTWALETTVGVNVAGDEVGEMSSTDLTSLTDSTNNLTVQAIVYNHVAAFDINWFNDDLDLAYGGTGKKLVCEKCLDDQGNKRSVTECCKEDSCCEECNGNCEACKSYMEALKTRTNGEADDSKKPIVLQLKNVVATWYYILRMLSTAIMLVVLIGIGIKMAISTIASEKALYKRMLVDWVIGTIMVFSIHYIMYFTIFINESLVKVVEEAAGSINKVTLMQGSKQKGEREISDEEIEIDMYEAVRTRAYDPKMSVGLSGMIMYMTLVYFAIRYSLIYIKRYFTLLVLTIMGPAVGVAYALQKVLSGRSSSYKTWIKEYIMNVIIQTIHAIIYSVFISTALILSMESIAGLLVALILMNYSLKAEETFRKIFKFGDGDSLVGHTAEAGNAEKIKQNMQQATGLYMGAKPLAGALMNSPYAKVLKTGGKLAVASGGLVAGGVAKGAAAILPSKKERQEKAFNKAINNEMDEKFGGSAFKRHRDGSDAETEQDYENRRNAARESVLANNPRFSNMDTTLDSAFEASDTPIATLINKGEDKLRGNVEIALSDYNAAKGTDYEEEAKKKYEKALGDYTKYRSIGNPTTSDIIAGHAQRLVDVENHFHYSGVDKDGKVVSKLKFGDFLKGALGTNARDFKTGKLVHQKNGYFNQFSSENLLGFTKEDKKILKEQLVQPMLMGLGGMATMFFGMGTIVAHPKLGMGLLAGGIAAQKKAFVNPPKNRKYTGRYGFSKFSTPTMIDIQKAAIARANREMNMSMVAEVKKNHPGLYSRLRADVSTDGKLGDTSNYMHGLKTGKLSSVVATTLGLTLTGGIAALPLAAGSSVIANGVTKGLFKGRCLGAFGGRMDAINQHSAKQAREQQKTFVHDGLKMQSSIIQAEMNAGIDEIKDVRKNADRAKNSPEDISYKEAIAASLGYKYNSATEEFVIDTADERGKKVEELERKLHEKLKVSGYDKKTGTLDATIYDKDDSTSDDKVKIETKTSEIEFSLGSLMVEEKQEKEGADGKISTRKATAKEIDELNEALEKAVYQMLDAQYTEVERGQAEEEQKKKEQLLEEEAYARTKSAREQAKDKPLDPVPVAPKDIEDLSDESKNDATDKACGEIEKVLEQMHISIAGTDTRKKVREMVSAKFQFETAKMDVVAQSTLGDLNAEEQKAVKAQLVKSRLEATKDGKLKNAKFETARASELAEASLIQIRQPKTSGSEKLDKRTKDVQSFLSGIQMIETVTPKTSDKSKKVNSMVKEKRDKKLQQLLQLEIDGVDTVEAAVEQVTEKVKNKDKKGLADLGIVEAEADSVVELLLKRKELDEINLFAKDELELKKGTLKYKQATKDKGTEAVSYYQDKVKLEQYEHKEYLEFSDGYDKFEEFIKDQVKAKNISSFEGERKKKEFKDMRILQQGLEAKERKVERAEMERTSYGPITDINSFLNSRLG